MIPRILEPEVMDSAAEAMAYDEMNHDVVNESFVRDLLGHLPSLDENEMLEVLDVGTGTGLIPLELCRRYDECRVVGIDLATSMLDLGRCNVEAAGFRDRIRFDRIDAKQMPFPDDQFAVVMSNSILHHIPLPATVLEESNRVTKRGGLIFFRDLMRPQDEATLEGLVQTYAGTESEHARQLFRDSLHAALTLDEIRDIVVGCGFATDSVQSTSDRHWTWIGKPE